MQNKDIQSGDNVSAPEQRSTEWFQSRIGRVTGSAVGAILGLSPFADADSVLRRMVREYHGAPSEFDGNPATTWGTFHEGIAKADFEMATGKTVLPAPFVEFQDWLGASPDGYVDDDALAEYKCPYSLREKENPQFKSVYEQYHYYAQVQVQLYVTGRAKCYFFQWAPKGTLAEIVPFSPLWCDDNLPKLKAFHERYLSELNNPEHLRPKAKKIANADVERLLEEYDQLKVAIEQGDERCKEILASLVAMAGNADALLGHGGRKLTHVERAGSVDYKKVPELKGVDLEPYRKAGSNYWRLS